MTILSRVIPCVLMAFLLIGAGEPSGNEVVAHAAMSALPRRT